MIDGFEAFQKLLCVFILLISNKMTRFLFETNNDCLTSRDKTAFVFVVSGFGPNPLYSILRHNEIRLSINHCITK